MEQEPVESMWPKNGIFVAIITESGFHYTREFPQEHQIEWFVEFDNSVQDSTSDYVLKSTHHQSQHAESLIPLSIIIPK